MDIDTAKENIQPLRHGRRADRLENALSTEKESLEQERKQFENEINNYSGVDPLSPWYEYICWIEQSFPNGSTLQNDVISKCLMKFESEPRYRQDRRLIKLFIKYIDTQSNPSELYSQLYSNGLGTMVADLYVAWSHYYDAVNDFKQAEAIFQKGINAGAQPFDELTLAHQNFSVSISQRLIYDDEESKKKFRASIEEKRNALTSLRAHKKKFVGSVRTGNAVKDENPGKVKQFGESSNQFALKDLKIHVDDQDEVKDEPQQSLSIFKGIVESSSKVKNENFLEPGTWSKIKMNKAACSNSKVSTLDFQVMEDDDDSATNLPPIPCKNKLYHLGAQLPSNFVDENKPQYESSGNFPIIIEEPIEPRVIRCYNTFACYPNAQTEISPEEVKAFEYLMKTRNYISPVVVQYASILLNGYNSEIKFGVPSFISHNKPQSPMKLSPFELEEEVVKRMQVPVQKMYEGNTEKSMDEIYAMRYYQEADYEEADMELTMIGDRRQSIYPQNTRKSFVPRKSILRKSIAPKQIIEEEEDEEKEKIKIENQPRVRFEEPIASPVKSEDDKLSLKRKLSTPDKPIESKTRFVHETPPPAPKSVTESNQINNEIFKPPLPVNIRPFEAAMEEEETFCSTQQFNFFVKAHSVSTPNSKKTVPKLVPLASVVVDDENCAIPKENSSPPVEKVIENSPEVPETEDSPNSNEISHHQAPCGGNYKLSTIMEVTETTQSTKSSCNETDLQTKTPMSIRKKEISMHDAVGCYRIPEEQTETAPFVFRGGKLIELNDTKKPNVSLRPEMTSFQVALPQIEDSHVEIPATQELEIPAPQAQEMSSFQIVIPPFEESKLEIQATQERELSVKKINFEDADKTITNNVVESSMQVPYFNGDFSHIEIPATQEIEREIKDTEEIIPPTQDISLLREKEKELQEVDIELPPTQQPFEIYVEPEEKTQIDCKASTSALKKEEENKKFDFQFNIYEDSICGAPQAQEQSREIDSNKNKKRDDYNESKMMHVSCKENLILPIIPSSSMTRSTSDELLELCSKSPTCGIKSMITTNVSVQRDDISDLLKFSDMKSLEGSLKALELQQPPTTTELKSASPTMNIFEEDLNTERFKLPLVGGKNSTLLFMPTTSNEGEMNKLNFSLEMNEDEIEQMSNAGEKDVIFKIPQIPKPAKPKPVHNVTPFAIFEDSVRDAPPSNSNEEEEADGDVDDDMSTTIYYENFEKAPIVDDEQEKESGDHQEWENEMMCSFMATTDNRYEYTIMHEEKEMSMKIRQAIEESDGNPFDEKLHNLILEQCNFEKYLELHVPHCKLLKNIPKLKPGMTIEIQEEVFKAGKFIAKGSFGSIFMIESIDEEKMYAAKQEKPANLWEFYICMELSDRLKSNHIDHVIPAFMQINKAIIANNSSIFISELSPYGTIIDVCNKVRKVTGKNLDEYITMIFTSQILSIVDYLHSCHIIHADIKPDNFLLMRKIGIGMKVPALQLIDFGTAIDMDVYTKEDQFNYVVKTENFTCCEMLEKKPWTYQIDLFGVAGTAHVMLFGKYMKVEKRIGQWDIVSKYPRYFREKIWKAFFKPLLNIYDSDTLPDLQELKALLEDDIQNREKYVLDKVAEFNSAISS